MILWKSTTLTDTSGLTSLDFGPTNYLLTYSSKLGSSLSVSEWLTKCSELVGLKWKTGDLKSVANSTMTD